MKVIARHGKYELIKDTNGVYLFCRCGLWVSCGYMHNDAEAINYFSKKFSVPVDKITIL